MCMCQRMNHRKLGIGSVVVLVPAQLRDCRVLLHARPLNGWEKQDGQGSSENGGEMG